MNIRIEKCLYHYRSYRFAVDILSWLHLSVLYNVVFDVNIHGPISVSDVVQGSSQVDRGAEPILVGNVESTSIIASFYWND